MGWDVWPNHQNQLNLPVVDEAQANLPAVEEGQDNVQAQLPIVQNEQAVEEVINIAADPLDQILAANEVIELSDSGVLAMDDGTDASEGEVQAPLLPIEPVQIVPFPDFNLL